MPTITRAFYTDSYALQVASWPVDARELEMWASRADLKLDAELLGAWSRVEGVSAYVFFEAGVPCAYAELWEDAAENEVELAHILVGPDHRRRGIGGSVVTSLVDEARHRGYESIWMRVVPWNEAALACYARAGFTRAAPDVEARFNLGQPRCYVWMSYAAP